MLPHWMQTRNMSSKARPSGAKRSCKSKAGKPVEARRQARKQAPKKAAPKAGRPVEARRQTRRQVKSTKAPAAPKKKAPPRRDLTKANQLAVMRGAIKVEQRRYDHGYEEWLVKLINNRQCWLAVPEHGLDVRGLRKKADLVQETFKLKAVIGMRARDKHMEVNVLWPDGSDTWEVFDLDKWVHNPKGFALLEEAGELYRVKSNPPPN